jgi:hypothetical protein
MNERVCQRVGHHVLERVLGRPERLGRVLERVVRKVGIELLDVGEGNVYAPNIGV